MRTTVLLMFVCQMLWQLPCLTSVAAPAVKFARKPIEQPAGEWTVKSIESNGQIVFSEKDFLIIKRKMCLRKNEIVVLRDDTCIASEPVAFFNNGGQLEVDFCADDAKKLRKGIFKVDGDSLIICVSENGSDRPSESTTSEASKRNILTLRRDPK